MASRIGRLYVQIDADASDLDTEVRNLGSSMSGAADESGGRWQSVLSSLGSGIATVATAAFNFGKEAVNAFRPVEQYLTRANLRAGDASIGFDNLFSTAVDLARGTIFAVEDVSTAIYKMAGVGVVAEDDIRALTQSAQNLALIAGTDLATAVEITAASLQLWGIEADYAGRVTDALAVVAHRTNTDVNAVGAALQYVTADARNAGLTLEETTAALGLMARAGYTGSSAGTTLGATLRELSNPGEAASQALERLGITTSDAYGNFLPFPEILAQFEHSLDGLDEVTRNMYIGSIFGVQGARGFNALLEQGSAAWQDLTDDVSKYGAAAFYAGEMSQTLENRFQTFENQVNLLKVEIGAALLPVVLDLLPVFSDVIGLLEHVLPVLTPVIEAFGSLVEALAPLIVALLDQLMPIVVEVAYELGENLATIIETLGEIIEALWPVVEEVFTFIGEHIGDIISIVVDVITLALALIQGDWDTVWSTVERLTDTVWRLIRNIVDTALTWIRNIVNNILSWVRDFIADLWQRVLDNTDERWHGIWDAIFTIVTTIWETVQEWFNLVWETVRSIWQTIVDYFNGDISLLDAIGNIFQAIVDYILNLASTFFNAGRNILQAVGDGMQAAVDNVLQTVSNIAGRIRGAFPFSPAEWGPFSGAGWTYYSGQAMMRDWADGMDAAYPYVRDRMDAVINAASASLDDTTVTRDDHVYVNRNTSGEVHLSPQDITRLAAAVAAALWPAAEAAQVVKDYRRHSIPLGLVVA